MSQTDSYNFKCIYIRPIRVCIIKEYLVYAQPKTNN